MYIHVGFLDIQNGGTIMWRHYICYFAVISEADDP